RRLGFLEDLGRHDGSSLKIHGCKIIAGPARFRPTSRGSQQRFALWPAQPRGSLTPALSPVGRGRPLIGSAPVITPGGGARHPLLPGGEKVPEGRMRGDSPSASDPCASPA